VANQIRGIETEYNGYLFRSRLEARWARFFTELGWQWTYEPFDLPGWIPDFLLHGKSRQILVEVKPVIEFPFDVAAKIDTAYPNGDALIVGTTPFLSRADHHLGWLRCDGCCDDGDVKQWEPAAFHIGSGVLGIHPIYGAFEDRINDFCDGDSGTFAYNADEIVRMFVDGKWAIACNTTRWEARR